MTYTRKDGYRRMLVNGREVLEHVLIAEKALGRRLRGTEEIHHFNECRSDNRPDNLVICPNHAYHALLHIRQDALAACGNPNLRRCKFCGSFDEPASMYKCIGIESYYHRPCRNLHQKQWRKQKCQPKP